MHIMIIKICNHTYKSTCHNFCMFYWSVKKGDKSDKSQGILISCVSGNPVIGKPIIRL